MRRSLGLVAMTLAFLLSPPASARGRFERGRNLYHRMCGPCFSMGWKWAPSSFRGKQIDVALAARKWTPAQVCTWLRRPTRRHTGAGCYPGRLSIRQKTEILYYLSRQLEGPIRKPVPVRIAPRRARKMKLRKTTAARRKRAEQRQKSASELRRIRRVRGTGRVPSRDSRRKRR